ncbi:MAG: tetratricopeptide repeat protein [Candidatus Omnitrophota bacterium]
MANKMKLVTIHSIAVCALIAAAACAYIPALGGDFVFDDHILIEDNPSIRDVRNIPLFFVSKGARIPKDFFGDLQSDIYRPFQIVSYTISYAIWGLNAKMFHAENVALHIACGVLLYFVILSLYRRKDAAFLAAILFLLHPVQVEAVAYLSGRADGLSLLFYLASFLAYVAALPPGGRKNALRWSSVAFFAVSLLSKETAATLPIIIILYHALFEGGVKKRTPREIAALVWPYVLVIAVFLIARTYNLGKFAQKPSDGPFITAIIMIRVFAEYLRLLIFPARLTFFHNVNFESVSVGIVYIAYLIVDAAFAFGCYAVFRKNRPLSFLLFAYLVALAPVSNIIPIKAYLQERFLYFPSVFILSFAAIAIVGFADRLKRIHENARILLAAPLAMALAAGTFGRNLDWKDERSLVMKEIALHPDRGMLYFDIGHLELRKGNTVEAERYLTTALMKDINETYKTKTLYALAKIYKDRGDNQKAIEYAGKALAVTPRFHHAMNFIGDTYFAEKEYKKAGEYFEQAVNLSPGSAEYSANLGTAYIMMNDREKALACWKRSLELDPSQANVRGYILKEERTRQGKDAVSAAPESVQAERVSMIEELNARGVVEGSARRLDSAIGLFHKALELDPDSAETLNNLGFAFFQKGDLAGAEDYFRKALEKDPGHKKAAANLRYILRLREKEDR